jgi:hypothetical protein
VTVIEVVGGGRAEASVKNGGRGAWFVERLRKASRSLRDGLALVGHSGARLRGTSNTEEL